MLKLKEFPLTFFFLVLVGSILVLGPALIAFTCTGSTPS
jgi:hypothetical protein